MELNGEKIIKALEWCASGGSCLECKYDRGKQFSKVGCMAGHMRDALALIKEQDEQIFKLENRLKECKNGYEGTLYLERCKLHDAEEKIKELTEDNERLRAERDTFEINYKDLKYRNNELIKDAVAWEHECREWEFENTVLREALAEAKADTVREFAERVKDCIHPDADHSGYELRDIVDQIAKEMLED